MTTHDADISAEIRTERHNQLFTLRAGGADLLAEAAGGHLHQWQEEFGGKSASAALQRLCQPQRGDQNHHMHMPFI